MLTFQQIFGINKPIDYELEFLLKLFLTNATKINYSQLAFVMFLYT